MAVPEETPAINFGESVEDFHKWFKEVAALTDIYEDFNATDVNNGMIAFILLHKIVSDHPDRTLVATLICNEVVKHAMNEGILASALHLTEAMEVPEEEVKRHVAELLALVISKSTEESGD